MALNRGVFSFEKLITHRFKLEKIEDAYDAWRTHCVCLAAEESVVNGFQKMKVDYTEP